MIFLLWEYCFVMSMVNRSNISTPIVNRWCFSFFNLFYGFGTFGIGTWDPGPEHGPNLADSYCPSEKVRHTEFFKQGLWPDWTNLIHLALQATNNRPSILRNSLKFRFNCGIFVSKIQLFFQEKLLLTTSFIPNLLIKLNTWLYFHLVI